MAVRDAPVIAPWPGRKVGHLAQGAEVEVGAQARRCGGAIGGVADGHAGSWRREGRRIGGSWEVGGGGNAGARQGGQRRRQPMRPIPGMPGGDALAPWLASPRERLGRRHAPGYAQRGRQPGLLRLARGHGADGALPRPCGHRAQLPVQRRGALLPRRPLHRPAVRPPGGLLGRHPAPRGGVSTRQRGRLGDYPAGLVPAL